MPATTTISRFRASRACGTPTKIDVSNCNLQSSSSSIRIGFLDQNPVRNVSNYDITNSTRGIGIFPRDKCSLKDLTLTNVRVETKLRTGD